MGIYTDTATPACLHVGTSKFGRNLAPRRVYVVNMPQGAFAFRSKRTAQRYKGVQSVAYAAGNIFTGTPVGRPVAL